MQIRAWLLVQRVEEKTQRISPQVWLLQRRKRRRRERRRRTRKRRRRTTDRLREENEQSFQIYSVKR